MHFEEYLYLSIKTSAAHLRYTKAEMEAIRLACPVTCGVCKPGMEQPALGTFGGPYFKLENISNTTFLRLDNFTRLRYVRG